MGGDVAETGSWSGDSGAEGGLGSRSMDAIQRAKGQVV